MKTLVMGGARSGKSSLATRLAREHGDDVCCIVTATASDPEMAARIAAHRKERPASWTVREEPVRLASALRERDGRHAALLIDCLTIWTANCLWPPERQGETDMVLWRREREAFLEALSGCASRVIVVTNEVGTGLVPPSAVARTFVDEHGWLNQAVARICDEVFHVTAGIPVLLKPRS